MRYNAEHKAATRARILEAAGGLFRAEGYGGSGIDGLTKAAGVTNGAFYGHFRSKAEAFRAAMVAGLDEVRLAVAGLKSQQPSGWVGQFIGYYLGPKRTCGIEQSCGLASLTADVMRADLETREVYGQEFERLVSEVTTGLAGDGRDDEAIALLALLSGGVTIARSVADPVQSARIAAAVERAALRMIG